MSELTDLLLSVMEPVTALLIIGLTGYLRQVKQTLHADLESVEDRVERLEGAFIPDEPSQIYADGGDVEREE